MLHLEVKNPLGSAHLTCNICHLHTIEETELHQVGGYIMPKVTALLGCVYVCDMIAYLHQLT